MKQVPKPLDPQELEQLKQQIACELHAQLAAHCGGKDLTQEQLAQVRSMAALDFLLQTLARPCLHVLRCCLLQWQATDGMMQCINTVALPVMG